jgi:hypothetical protein
VVKKPVEKSKSRSEIRMRKTNISTAKTKRNLADKIRRDRKRADKKRKYHKNQEKLARKLKARGEKPYSAKKLRRV